MEQIEEGILDPKEYLYIGESSRTARIRANQHKTDFKRRAAQEANSTNMNRDNIDKLTSFMYEHHVQQHPDEEINHETDFNFRVISKHRDPLDRQIWEAEMIKKAVETGKIKEKGGIMKEIFTLNKKSEHFAPIERWNKE